VADRSTDRRRLAAAERASGGGPGALRTLAYPAYLVVLLGAMYGFSTAQALFRTADPEAVRGWLMTPVALGVPTLAAIAAVLSAWRAGSVRGPVVPPLPWLDLVVVSSIDRVLSLRLWWRIALGASLIGCIALGAMIGFGLWYAAVTGPLAALVGIGVGAVMGALIALAWLVGQAGRQIPTGPPVASRLRAMRLEDLRAQSARSSRLGGAMLSGDLRAARLEVAAPVTRARGARLRSQGRWRTVVARDVLGARRAPASPVAGAVLLVAGTALAAVCLVTPALPGLAAILAAGLLHGGFAGWAEGMRLQADNSGTPALLGLPPRAEALAHCVLPGAAYLVVAAVVGTGVALGTGHAPGGVVGWLALMGLLLVGTGQASTFRVTPAIFVSPDPRGRLAWQTVPFAVTTLAGGLLTARIAVHGLSGELALASVIVVLALAWGWHRVGVRTDEHRA